MIISWSIAPDVLFIDVFDVQHLNEIVEEDVESGMVERKEIIMKPAKQTLEEDLVS